MSITPPIWNVNNDNPKNKLKKLQVYYYLCIVFNQWFNNCKHILIHKWWHRGFQILVYSLNMLAIQLKCQTLNSRIQVKDPPHVDAIMLELQQWFECPKVIYNEPGNGITIHIAHITLAYLQDYHQVTHKYIFHLCKLNDRMD